MTKVWRNINWRKKPYNKNRRNTYRSEPIIFPNPISERKRKERDETPLLSQLYVILYSLLPFSVLESFQVLHSLTWLVDAAEQNFRNNEPGQQAHQQKHPLHCKRNEFLSPPSPQCRYTVLLLKPCSSGSRRGW